MNGPMGSLWACVRLGLSTGVLPSLRSMPDRIGIRAEVERQVRDYFPHHVDGCEELERFASGMLEAKPWRGRAMGSSAADPLIAMESARSLKTYRAAVDGALGGFGPQAAMLNRAPCLRAWRLHAGQRPTRS